MDDLPPPPRPASLQRKKVWPWLLPAVVALAFGGFLGFQAGYQQSLGGFNTLNAAFIGFIIGVLVVIVGLVGIGNALRPAGRGRVASRYSFAAAGLIAAAGIGGYAAVPLLDLGYHPPIVLQAQGESSVSLDGVPDFEPRPAGRAVCQSVVAGTDVKRITALSLGQLNGGLLRGRINLPVAGTSTAYLSLFIDGAHLPEGSVQPMWNTQSVAIDAPPDRATGNLRFEAVPIRVDPEIGAPGLSWPATLSGEISWACEPWLDPGVSPPTAAAHITLDVRGVDWSSTGNAAGSCEFEEDGSVGNVVGDRLGTLQGEPMTLGLGLLGDPRPGDEVHLMLSVPIAAASPGARLPFAALVAATSGRSIGWTELVVIEEIADGGLSGRLTFSDLPNEGTQYPTWPATLSGELSWECGQ